MLGYFFVIHLLSSAQWPITEANKCVECASTNLKGRWGLTGFAQLFRSYSFTSTCATGADMEHYVRCSGYCMTYLFQNPDTVGTSDVELMVVRGCHQRLLGIQSVPLNNQTPNGSYCEYDKDLRRLDSQGNEVYIKALVEFCAGEVCNTRVKDFSVAPTCTGPTNSGSDSDRICYNCNAMEENCNYNQEYCSKKFCSKTTVSFHGNRLHAVHKACSDISLFAVGNGCTTFDIVAIPSNLLKLTGQITQCFCNDNDYCNGANTNTIVFSLMCAVFIFFSNFLKFEVQMN